MVKKKSRQFISALICLCLLVGMLPMGAVPAFAADTTMSVMPGASVLKGGQQSNVYFGNYQQSNLGSTKPTTGMKGIDWIINTAAKNHQMGPYYSIDPIKWRVLSNADGKLFLFADQNLDVFRYHTDDENVTWERSTIRSWLNGYGASSNTGGSSGVDYSRDNFLDSAFSAKEQIAVSITNVVNDDNTTYGTDGGNDTTDKIFLLSIAEALNKNYGFSSNDNRLSKNTAYVASGGKVGSSHMFGVGRGDWWWLRSPGKNNHAAVYVELSGSYDYGGTTVSYDTSTVRPAFNLNLNSVLFTSSAEGGKTATSVSAIEDYDGNEWKVTLLDESRSAFTAKTVARTGGTLTVEYENAATDANEYISVMIADSDGTYTHYGKIKNVADTAAASGTVEIDLSDIDMTGKTVYVFNEQCNGDYKTDYASELKAVKTEIEADVNKTIMLGASFLAPSDGTWDASDHKVYFGQYDGKPTAFRVLKVADGKLMLDCDTSLLIKAFDSTSNVWSGSDLESWLNGGDYYDSASVFTSVEKSAIAKTSLSSESKYKPINSTYYVDYEATDYVYLLSAREAAELYENNAAWKKTGAGFWWLRSAYDYNNDSAGIVSSSDGRILTYYVANYNGVSPTVNLNMSSVLFTSANTVSKSSDTLTKVEADSTTKEWKLTLLDSAKNIKVTDGEVVAQHGSIISVPYTYEGSNVDQISVMITSGNYKNFGTEILYYGKLNTEFSASGTGTFELPEGLPEGYKIYILAEDVNGAKYTDYASAPVEISVHTHNDYSYTDNGDGTHKKDCNLCDIADVESENHVFDQEKVDAAYKKSTALYYKSCICGASSQGTDAESVFEDISYGNMQIFVKTLSGNHITLSVMPTDTIDSIRERVAFRENLSEEYIKLLYAGKALEAGKTLSDYSIQKDSTLQLMLVLPINYKERSDQEFSGTLGANSPITHTYGTETQLVNPTKVGYIFGGWHSDPLCCSDIITSLGATDYTGEIKLYTYWTECDHSGNTNTDDGDCTTTVICSVCGGNVIDAKTHDFTGEWQTDTDGHWHICQNEDCTVPDTKFSHSGGTATCTKKAVCEVCNEPYGDALGHDFTGAFDACDENRHWHICNRDDCNVTDTPVSHSFTEYNYNNDATYFKNGTKTATCDADGCEQTDTIEAEGTKLVDAKAPTGTITVKENGFKSFINTITFGLFCKDKYDVTITAEDAESGVDKIEYLVSDTAISENDIYAQDGWTAYSAFSIANKGKHIVYAKLTDKVGNVTYISSDGLVIYSDSTIGEADANISYTIGSESGASATVTLNGNTVKEIKNGDAVLTSTDYTVDENGKITFNKDYLDTLVIGEYTLTVSFNPLGEEYKTAEGNEAPTAVTINLTVYRNMPESLVKQDGTLTYNGKAQTPEVKATGIVDDKNIAYTYSDSIDGEYIATLPTFTNAGEHTVYYKATAEYHNAGSGNFTVTVEKATVTEPTIASKVYTGEPLTADVPASDLYTVETNNGGTNKGSYDVVLGLAYSDNYKWSYTDEKTITLTFTIADADNSWIMAPSIADWTYGDAASTPEYEAKFGTVTVTYTGTASDGTDYNGTTPPVKVGEYTATFAVVATEDYGSLSKSVDFIINPRKVTVTADNASKAYGDSDPEKFDWNVTSGEIVNSDDLGITVSRESGENVEIYGIIIDKSNANPNYDITVLNGTFTITKALLTVTADNKTATYGDEVPIYSVSYNGFKFSDNAESLDGTLAFDCDYKQFSDKGTYTVTPKGYASDNYDFKYVDGTLTVSAKEITVTIKNATSIYGDSIATLTATENGIVNNDNNVFSLSTTASKTGNVGKYDITGTTLDDNYIITFENEADAYEITKREVTVNVIVADKKYDGLNGATITKAELVNVANGDQITLISGIATFETVDKADDISIVFTDFAISGDKADNYTLIQPSGVKANITNGWNPAVNTEYTVSEPNSNGWLNADFVITAKNGYQISLTNTASGEWKDSLVGAVEGNSNSVTFYVKNTANGMISEATTESYKLDKVSPTGKVSFEERSGWESFLNNISFGLFYNDEVTVKVTAEDTISGVEKIEYIESGKALTLDEVKALTDWTVMSGDGLGVTLEDAKRFVYYVRIADKAGNVTYLSTDGAEYDTTAPAISGVENGKTYYTTHKVTVTDKNLDTVTLNGKAVTGTITLGGDVDKVYTIVATDKVGNTKTVTVTMKPIATLSENIGDITTDTVKPSDADTIQAVKDAVAAVDTTNATETETAELKEITDKCDELIKKIADSNNSATEEIKKIADSNSPTTGENSNMFLWIALLVVSGGAMTVLVIVGKKKKNANK